MKIAAVINASGGTVRANPTELSEDNLRRRFEALGLYPELRYASGEDVAGAIDEALTRSPDVLIAGGGDGTLNTAAAALLRHAKQQLAARAAPSPVAAAGKVLVAQEPAHPMLGILPLGTLNHFAKDIGLGADLDDALRCIAAGHTRTVDVGTVNGHVFLNNSSIGAYPDAVRRREALREMRGYRKWPAMALAMSSVLRNLRRLRAKIRIDDAIHARRTPLVLVSNNRYDGHLFSRTLRPRLDAGELWVYSIRARGFFPLLALTLLALAGRLDEAEDFELWSARDVVIALKDSNVQVAIDGEVVCLQTPLHFTLRAAALQVLAPPLQFPSS